MGKKKSWIEKLHDSKDLPKVVELTGKQAEKWGEGTMAIPAPLEVDALMKKIPEGKLTTINLLRKKIAEKHSTTVACPISTGIFAWIAAHAAEELKAKGEKEITPWWRTLKEGGLLNPKYPGGIEKQMELLESEGHVIVPKGKKNFMVSDFDKKLV